MNCCKEYDLQMKKAKQKSKEVKEMFSKEVLSQISDGAAQDIIREIMLSDKVWINWSNVEPIIFKHMPELNVNRKQ